MQTPIITFMPPQEANKTNEMKWYQHQKTARPDDETAKLVALDKCRLLAD
jgi:hypothetical protein